MKTNLLYFCIAAAAGVAIGVLTAPRAGEQTRSLLRDTAENGMREMKMRGQKLDRAVSKLRQDGTRIVAGQGEAIKAAVAAGKSAYLHAAG